MGVSLGQMLIRRVRRCQWAGIAEVRAGPRTMPSGATLSPNHAFMRAGSVDPSSSSSIRVPFSVRTRSGRKAGGTISDPNERRSGGSVARPLAVLYEGMGSRRPMDGAPCPRRRAGRTACRFGTTPSLSECGPIGPIRSRPVRSARVARPLSSAQRTARTQVHVISIMASGDFGHSLRPRGLGRSPYLYPNRAIALSGRGLLNTYVTSMSGGAAQSRPGQPPRVVGRHERARPVGGRNLDDSHTGQVGPGTKRDHSESCCGRHARALRRHARGHHRRRPHVKCEESTTVAGPVRFSGVPTREKGTPPTGARRGGWK